MKWLIILALLAIPAYLFIADDSVAHSLWSSLDEHEGKYPNADFDQEKFRSLSEAPQAFLDKYQPFLEKRYYVVRYAFFLGNYKFCGDMCSQILDRYKDSAITSNEKYQDMVFYKGRCLEEVGDRPSLGLARTFYSQLLEKYPDNHFANEARQRLADLDILFR